MKEQAAAICTRIVRALDGRPLNLMHVCGTHEDAIAQHGLRSLLPANLRLVMGPGCPVCITPQGDIDAFVELSRTPGVLVATYGDLLKVPGSRTSLLDGGGRYKVVQSPHQAARLAADHPNEKVVFLSIGFETTAPATAATLFSGAPDNFLVYSAHRLIPPALRWLLASGEVHVDGFLLPGHVSTIIGTRPYEGMGVPQVIAGFEVVNHPRHVVKSVAQCNHRSEREKPFYADRRVQRQCRRCATNDLTDRLCSQKAHAR